MPTSAAIDAEIDAAGLATCGTATELAARPIRGNEAGAAPGGAAPAVERQVAVVRPLDRGAGQRASTGILRPAALFAFCKVTVSTPFAQLAFTLSAATGAGSCSSRRKAP